MRRMRAKRRRSKGRSACTAVQRNVWLLAAMQRDASPHRHHNQVNNEVLALLVASRLYVRLSQHAHF